MRPATDSAARLTRNVFWTVLTCSAAVHGLGCARLEQFRTGDRPVLGALGSERGKASGKDGGSAAAAKPVDTYAQALREKKAQSDRALLAERSAGGTAAADSESLAQLETEQPSRRSSAGAARRAATDAAPLRVTLQPPVSLEEGQTVLAASRSDEPTGWQSPKTALEDRDPPLRRTATVPPRPEEREQPPIAAASLVNGARTRLDQLGNYQVQLNRQERVGGKLLPVEDVLLSVRRSPKAVRLEWPDGPHKGREVIYSASENGGLMQVNMADSLVPARMSLRPDSPLVMSNSRHPITEAGFDGVLANLEQAIQGEKAGSPTGGIVKYGGRVEADGLDHPCDKLVRVTPSGETWVVFLDPETKLPALVQGNAPDGSLLERYRFLNVKGDVPALAQADAFDAARRWGPPKGLLSRLARPTTGTSKPAASETVVR